MRDLLDLLYISKARAREVGLTHEGTLFGVPAWFAEDDGEVAMATPKVPALHVWCWLADGCYELASWFMPSHVVLESPIRVTRPI